MSIYLYGIIDSNDKLSNPITGLAKTTVYNIPYRDIGVVACDLTEEIKGVQEARIFEHEAVVEHLMEHGTVLPVRFHTVFHAREEILLMMEKYYREFRENLNNLHNKVEFGIKILWDGDAVKKRITRAIDGSNGNRARMDDSPARRFIRKKFGEYEINREMEKEADRCIEKINRIFEGVTADKKLEKLKTKNLLLSAVYLIEKIRQDKLKEAFECFKKRHREFQYLFTGPWPPYNFVTVNGKVNRINHDN